LIPEPWVRFEDEHLLAVAKPAGINTHRADAHAQDGMYEWVQRQRPAESLSVVHRLDKATSGLLLFGKTAVANRSLTSQLEQRAVAKRYELLVQRDDHRPDALRCDQPISRRDRGRSVDLPASTSFELEASGLEFQRLAARPHTGRTHQVRVHAAALDMPIVGDSEHGGSDGARLFLHAAGLQLDHPTAGRVELAVDRPASFDLVLACDDPRGATGPSLAALVAHEARALLFDPTDTDAYLWIDRHHDGFAGIRVERLGDVALVLNYDDALAPMPEAWLEALNGTVELRSVYEQRRPRGDGGPARLASGVPRDRFEVTELGCHYLIDLQASPTSSGLFLDQRESRRRLRTSDLTGRSVLNAFAHTGSLSVAAALAGAETLSLDLSKRYLDWAADNMRINDLDPADHDFVYGDAMEWMARFAKKGRTFDLVLVDPPSSSTTRHSGAKRWAVDRDLHALVERAANLCSAGGTLFVSTNLRRMQWPRFMDHIERGLSSAGRQGTVETQTLPLDHRSGPADPPYLKAAWIELDTVGGAGRG
jgi:23S rRNA (cytosine1962-C5)-methyltransferase